MFNIAFQHFYILLLQLARHGLNIVMISRTLEKMQRVANEIGKCLYHICLPSHLAAWLGGNLGLLPLSSGVPDIAADRAQALSAKLQALFHCIG